VNKPAEPDRYPVIVGIGASAGGIQALLNFFRALPAQTGAAFVVVVHLDPDASSELPHILAQRASMPVVQVDQQTTLQPNTVYVIPPGRQLQLTNHEIAAVPFQEPRGQRAPIDMFFRSLGEKTAGIAVILTGAGSDGALGVKAIKEAGGVVLVQEPSEAEYSSMPRAAIATGVADFVLPIRDLAQRVVDVVRMKEVVDLPLLDELQDEEQRINILSFLRVRTGHDFSHYKRSTVLRRIIRRMHVTHSDSMRAYHDYIRSHPDEANELLSDLLISVTTFFRDRESFTALARLMPQLFTNAGQETIRVWVAGCATGEEAYSIGMMLLEEAGRHEPRPRLQVFASDLDTRALGAARLGSYPVAVEADVSEERLRRFFTREGDHYWVRAELKNIVLFTVHDLLKDPPFSKLELVSCRNVLIYLDRDLQEQVLSTFNYALNPGGLLLLGPAETVDNPPGLFRMLDRSARIYQTTLRHGDRPQLVPRLLAPLHHHLDAQVGGPHPPLAMLAWSEAARHRAALERMAPPSMLVDEQQRVLHLSNHAGRFLAPAGGTLTGDAVDLTREELRFELRSALHRAFEQKAESLSLPILLRLGGTLHRVQVYVQPNEPERPGEPATALVLFLRGEAVDEATLSAAEQEAQPRLRLLVQEMELKDQRLRTMREEFESTNEELRAANEELQSTNEEYRSTSEELETSKEELQSVNEELSTLNTELKLKLDNVSRANNDLQNLMAASDFGTLFLDANLRIKRLTERVSELFAITAADEGRLITDFANKLDYGDLVSDLRAVLADLTPIRRELKSHNGRWFDVRLRPYRTTEDKIEGTVLTFIDITERRQADEQLRQTRELITLARDPIFVWDMDAGITSWNRGSEELYGYSNREVLGRWPAALLETQPTAPGLSIEALLATLVASRSWRGPLLHRTKDGRRILVDARLQLEIVEQHRLVLESIGQVIGTQEGAA
jgi:two-component system CheB/CheR fusion protein